MYCTQTTIKAFSKQKGQGFCCTPRAITHAKDKTPEGVKTPSGVFCSSLDNNKGTTHRLTPEQIKKYNPWSKKQRRFYQRAMSGMASGGQLRFLTLTSSPQSDGALLTKHLQVLKQRIKRRGWEKRKRGERKRACFEYLGTQEETHSGLRHVHILYKGCYIPQRWLSASWGELHKAPIVHVCSVRQNRVAKYKIAGYISKYLNKQMTARFLCSWHWVFRGFVGRWKMFKKEFGGEAMKEWGRLLAGEKISIGKLYEVLPPPDGRVVLSFEGLKQSLKNQRLGFGLVNGQVSWETCKAVYS